MGSFRFTRSTAASRLPCSSHLAVMLGSQSLRCGASALMSQDRSRSHALLLNEIIGQGERRAEVLSAMRRAVLWKVGNRFERQIGIGDQFTKGHERSAVRCHTSTLTAVGSKSNR